MKLFSNNTSDSEKEARDTLKKYESTFYHAVQNAVDTINKELPPKIINAARDGTIASLITDLIVSKLKSNFTGSNEVVIKEKTNTTVFRIGGLIFKVKKLNSKNLAGYNHTPTSKKFTSQGELFGGEYQLTSLHLGYKLNDLGILEEVLITCPINNGNSNAWSYELSKTAVDRHEKSQSEPTQDSRLKLPAQNKPKDAGASS